MFQFVSLSSGSSGNCYYISNGMDAVLIDAGASLRKVRRCFREYGIKTSTLRAVLITHDHADHVKDVGSVSAELNLPVFTTEKVHEGIQGNYRTKKKIDPSLKRMIRKEEVFRIGSLVVTPFGIPHDSMDNVGYSIQSEGLFEDGVFTVMTDIGHPTGNVSKYVSISNFLVIEANYDKEKLRLGRYPRELQDRIRGGNGHLSNEQSAEILAGNFHEGLKKVWLCHLSAENNTPELASKTIEYHLRSYGIIAGKDFTLDVLKRRETTGPFFFSLSNY